MVSIGLSLKFTIESLGPVMLGFHTKIAALKSSPFSHRTNLTSSASNKGNLHKISSLFSPKSTPPRSNHRRALAKSLKKPSKPFPNATISPQFDVNQPQTRSNCVIQSDPRPPISSFIHSFSALVDNRNYPEAVYCYKRFAVSRLPSNFFTLNVLLNCYCNLRLASGGGFSVFGIILKSGFSPNTITLTSLVKGLCLEERIGDAFELFRKMIQLGCYPNVVTCSTLISGLCKAGNAAAALELHREMLAGEVSLDGSCNPTVVSYGSLIDGVCKAGLLVKARELLLEMKGRGISPNVVVYTSLLDRLCWSGKWEEARLLYGEMMDDGVQPNVMTFNVILNSLCRQGQGTKAKELELMAQSGGLANVVYKFLMEGTV